jgi:hypothetical protein
VYVHYVNYPLIQIREKSEIPSHSTIFISIHVSSSCILFIFVYFVCFNLCCTYSLHTFYIDFVSHRYGVRKFGLITNLLSRFWTINPLDIRSNPRFFFLQEPNLLNRGRRIQSKESIGKKPPAHTPNNKDNSLSVNPSFYLP